MKSQRKQGSDERRVLIGMITDRKVLRSIAGHWTPEGLFASEHANLIARWCVSYYARHAEPPGRSILSRFERWAESGRRDDKTVDAVDRFLSGLDAEYDPDNRPKAEEVIDAAEELFRKVAQKRVAERAEELNSAGRIDEAGAVLSAYKEINLNGSSVRSLEDVEMRDNKWLWKPWLPAGELAIIDGDPGLGKSTLLIDVAARVTNGWKMPPRPRGEVSRSRKPGNVLVLAVEDSVETTIAPRCKAAGADMARLFVPKDEDLTIPSGLAKIEAMIRDHGARFVIFDPIMSFLEPNTNSNAETDVRRVLRKLQGVAVRTKACVVMLRHLNKTNGGKAMYRGGGSIAWTAVCRVQHVVGIDPDDAEGFLLAPGKLNLEKKPKPLRYRIEGVEVPWKGKDIGTSAIAWGGTHDTATADTAVTASRAKPDKIGRAADLARKLLRKAGGKMSAEDLSKTVRFECGLKVTDWKRVRDRAGLITDKVDGKWVVREK